MLYIIVVSHRHDEYVKVLLDNIFPLPEDKFKIVVKDNVKSAKLRSLCSQYGAIYLTSPGVMGFGENNNYAVKYIKDNYGIQESDWLLIVNPDVVITKEVMHLLDDYLNKNSIDMFTIDLFKDKDLTKRDLFIRRFPGLKDFISSYLFRINSTIVNRDNVNAPLLIDWCAGSFIGIKLKKFIELKGFDELYFMYCEDVDFCYRAKLSGLQHYYLPQFTAIHYAHHENRKIFSRAFFWHLKSTLRFLMRKNITYKITKATKSIKSCL